MAKFTYYSAQIIPYLKKTNFASGKQLRSSIAESFFMNVVKPKNILFKNIFWLTFLYFLSVMRFVYKLKTWTKDEADTAGKIRIFHPVRKCLLKNS